MGSGKLILFGVSIPRYLDFLGILGIVLFIHSRTCCMQLRWQRSLMSNQYWRHLTCGHGILVSFSERMFFKQTMSVNIHTREKSFEYSQLLLLYAKPPLSDPIFFSCPRCGMLRAGRPSPQFLARAAATNQHRTDRMTVSKSVRILGC